MTSVRSSVIIGMPGVEGRVDVPDVLQVIPVRAIAVLVSLLEDQERGVPHDAGKIPARERELTDGLLGEHRGRVVPSRART